MFEVERKICSLLVKIFLTFWQFNSSAFQSKPRNYLDHDVGIEDIGGEEDPEDVIDEETHEEEGGDL